MTITMDWFVVGDFTQTHLKTPHLMSNVMCAQGITFYDYWLCQRRSYYLFTCFKEFNYLCARDMLTLSIVKDPMCCMIIQFDTHMPYDSSTLVARLSTLEHYLLSPTLSKLHKVQKSYSNICEFGSLLCTFVLCQVEHRKYNVCICIQGLPSCVLNLNIQ